MQNQTISHFKSAFRTLNALIWPVFVLTILEAWSITTIFRFPLAWNQYLIFPEFILKTTFILVVNAFVYGFLVDLATGREYLQTKPSFIKNLKTFLKTSVSLLFLSFFVDFILFICLGHGVPFHLTTMILSPLIVFIWLKVVFARKFSKEINKTPLLNAQGWVVLAILSTIYYILYAFFFIFFEQAGMTKYIFAFLLKYLNLWIFLVLSYQIIERFSLRLKQDPDLKEIYLINPPSGGIILSNLSLLIHKYPLIFVILKALSPQRYVFKEFNQVIWQEDYYTGGKLVAITCFTSNCIEAYKIAKEFRKKGSRVIMGGAHVTAFPEEALEFCDAVVVGPVEGVWARIIEDYEADKMQGIYAGPPTDDAYEKVSKFLLTQEPAVIADCMETARGCKFNCYFCGGGHSKTGHHRMALEMVIELLRKAKTKKGTIVFFDDNIYSDPVYAKELFKMIKPLNIKWLGSSTLDIARDPEALKLCKESGCSMLLIGYEIFPGSKEAQRSGKFSLADDYIHLTRVIQKAGIGIKAHFIYGFETDTFKTFWQLWFFALRLFPTISSLCILTPVPNSSFYKEIEKKDGFINLNWSKYAFLSLVHKHPVINNGLFRNGALLVVYFFSMTTSKMGICLVVILIGYYRLFIGSF
jgi:hypothetical protein